MREIDINRVMSQLGISSIDFVSWQNKREQLDNLQSAGHIESPVESLNDPTNGSSIELTY